MLTEWSDGWGERSGGGAGRVGTWGKPVYRLAGLSAGRKSGAGAGGFYATGEHTSEVESSQRGVKPVKFCRDSAIF